MRNVLICVSLVLALMGCIVEPYHPEQPLQIGMTENEAVTALGSGAMCIDRQWKGPYGNSYAIRMTGGREMYLNFDRNGKLSNWNEVR